MLDTESQVRDPPGARPLPRFTDKIEFANANFGYVAKHPVFDNLNLKVAPGQFVTLVSPTGSGKSTLIGMVARFYDPVSGEIKIDGEGLRSFTLKSIRQQISFVNSFDPTSTYPEFPNDRGQSTKNEKQTQRCEEHGEQENEN